MEVTWKGKTFITLHSERVTPAISIQQPTTCEHWLGDNESLPNTFIQRPILPGHSSPRNSTIKNDRKEQVINCPSKTMMICFQVWKINTINQKSGRPERLLGFDLVQRFQTTGWCNATWDCGLLGTRSYCSSDKSISLSVKVNNERLVNKIYQCIFDLLKH